jgi:hypothetical protein
VLSLPFVHPRTLPFTRGGNRNENSDPAEYGTWLCGSAAQDRVKEPLQPITEEIGCKNSDGDR